MSFVKNFIPARGTAKESNHWNPHWETELPSAGPCPRDSKSGCRHIPSWETKRQLYNFFLKMLEHSGFGRETPKETWPSVVH